MLLGFPVLTFSRYLAGREDGRPPGLVSGDSTRRRMSGPILNSVNISKQKNPAPSDAAVSKEVMVRFFATP